jgi:hypothetical protein
MVFYQIFLLSALQCTVETARGCVSLKKKKTQGKAVEVTVYSKNFVQEFGLKRCRTMAHDLFCRYCTLE